MEGQENPKSRGLSTKNSEKGLDKLMETCLEEGQLRVMERTLKRVSQTYANHDFYLKKLEEAERNKRQNFPIKRYA